MTGLGRAWGRKGNGGGAGSWGVCHPLPLPVIEEIRSSRAGRGSRLSSGLLAAARFSLGPGLRGRTPTRALGSRGSPKGRGRTLTRRHIFRMLLAGLWSKPRRVAQQPLRQGQERVGIPPGGDHAP